MKIPFIKSKDLNYEFYELQEDINYFGEEIKRGVRYYESTESKDWFIPLINGYICPSQKLHFTYIIENDKYFVFLIAVVKK